MSAAYVEVRKGPGLLLLIMGFLVGTLDILAAFTQYYLSTGKGPEGVLRYIASGVFGKEAFTGGTGMVYWGLFFHFLIAYSFTLFFYWLYKQRKPGAIFPRYPFLTAFLYAIFMWLITQQIVVPLSNVPFSNDFQLRKGIEAVMILTLMIGIPLSLAMKRYFKEGNISNKSTEP